MSPRYLVACLVLATVALSLDASAQTRLIRQVIGSGAAAAASPQYLMAGTIGQTIIGRSTSSSNLGALGFWYTYPYAYTSSVRQQPSAMTGEPGLSLAISPNPATETAMVTMTLPSRGHASLRLYDKRGAERLWLMDGEQESGDRTIPLPVAQLESGDYSLVLVVGAQRVVERVQVVR